jgi:hypothetical protein
MPGLIGLASGGPATQYDPNRVVNAGSTGYDATLGTVNLDTDTVSGQLDRSFSARELRERRPPIPGAC